MIRRTKNTLHLLFALLANLIFRFPARNLKVIGVTGTDGKTTVVHLIYEMLKAAGKKVSIVSSVKAGIAGKEYETGFHVTTPNPWLLQKFIRRAVDRGEKYLVLEVTSHALDQHRVFGCNFYIGVLTNVTHEHLDYHKTYENYLATKLKLLKRAKIAIVNREDQSFKEILNSKSEILNKFKYPNSKFKTKRVMTYGINNGDITLDNFKFTTPLPGEYNQYNCLAAIAATKQLGIEDKIIRQVLAQFKGVIGRFEFIKTGRDFDVIIDFAHTPNALEQVLKTIKPMVFGRLIHVFGSAGLRDKTKRPIMGEISAKYADIIILTEEDYRTESLEEIMSEIESGVRKNPKSEIRNSKSRRSRGSSTKPGQIQNSKFKLLKIPNRQEAINKAVRLAKKKDLVLLTGKGHEKSLCRGKKEYPWSEHEAVKKALRSQTKNQK